MNNLFLLISEIILIVVFLSFIMLPLLQSNKQKRAADASQVDRLLLEKETLYADIKDLEFDYKMGKLSQKDYNELKEDLVSKAAIILKQIEGLKK